MKGRSFVTAELQTRTVRSADGTAIGFVTVGSGPAVIVVHGALTTGDEWHQVAVAMADHHTVHVMDRRGRGRSGDGADYRFDREIEDIGAVVEAAGVGAHLVGHSSGAIYALEAARRFPIGQLVLYEPPLNFKGREAATLVETMRVKRYEENSMMP